MSSLPQDVEEALERVRALESVLRELPCGAPGYRVAERELAAATEALRACFWHRGVRPVDHLVLPWLRRRALGYAATLWRARRSIRRTGVQERALASGEGITRRSTDATTRY